MYCNDEHTQVVEDGEVLGKDAYMLLYERVKWAYECRGRIGVEVKWSKCAVLNSQMGLHKLISFFPFINLSIEQKTD